MSFSLLALLLLALAFVLLAGCSTHQPYAPPSYQLPLERSLLALHINQLSSDAPAGTSGFMLLEDSSEAFRARGELIRHAQTSIDVQYYIVKDGLTTRTLVQELLDAADRGVRVRILLDDTSSDGRDHHFAALAAHPNVHIRVFNALHYGRQLNITRNLGRLLQLSRQHRRMHNKLMLADNSVAIVGGRNLGDEYFDANQTVNFTDLDLLAAGPVARELGASFDEYWNHTLSTPILSFFNRPPNERKLRRARKKVTQTLSTAQRVQPANYDRLMAYKYTPKLYSWLDQLMWAPAQAMWDNPDKVLAEGTPDPQLLLTQQLSPAMQTVENELILVAAYFVPTRTGVSYFAERAQAGVKIRVLTNSLEATDVPAVHGGYAPYRKELLKLGMQLYELRRLPGQQKHFKLKGQSESSLHSKAAIFDQRRVFLGSLNFDPRSVLWNTEVGILVDSPELSQQVRDLTLQGMSPDLSYEVQLRGPEGQEELVWLSRSAEGKLITLTKEPGGFWRTINAKTATLIGLEKML